MGTLGPMDNGTNKHWEKMGIWGKWAPGKMNTIRPKSAIGANGHWDKWALGENGHQEKRAPEEMGIGQLGQMSTLGKWMFGTNEHVGTGTNECLGN